MAAKNYNYLYYVEGEDDEAIVKALKNKYIISGKILCFNVVEKEISTLKLRTIKENTVIILVFDVDTNNINTITKNIEVLKKCKNVKEIILIPQVENLEDELIRSTSIRKIKELTNSKSTTDFKRDLLKATNTLKLLENKKFDINKFWIKIPNNNFKKFENMSYKIKVKSSLK